MSKKIVKKNKTVVDLNKLSFADLHAMYILVSGLNNSVFGKKVQAKSLFRDKLAEIENELYNRVFGLNPFSLEKPVTLPAELVEIKGQDPVKVISSFDMGKGTFVVAKNEEKGE